MKLYKSETLNKFVYIVTNSFVVVLVASFFILPTNVFVNAQYLDSTSYQLENPVTIIEGGESSSTSFRYLSGSGQLDSGQSTSTSFESLAGTLYYPASSTPILAAVAGNMEVALSWSAPTTVYGNITSYSVGIATHPDGPYTYSTVGNTLNTTRTGLTNTTTYYFKVRSYAAGLVVSESAYVSSIPQHPGVVLLPVQNSINTSNRSINFSGLAYPQAKVFVLEDGNLVATAIADLQAKFNVSLNNISEGGHTFSIYATDSQGNRSSSISLSIKTGENQATNISGIFLSPTIAIDKNSVKQGNKLSIFGQSVPGSNVTVSINTPNQFFTNVKANDLGLYSLEFDTTGVQLGNYKARAKSIFLNEASNFGNNVSFIVGDENKKKDPKSCADSGSDLNCDSKVNLIDFSIMAFWYQKPNPPKQVDLNGDGVVNLVDFSILAYNWTD